LDVWLNSIRQRPDDTSSGGLVDGKTSFHRVGPWGRKTPLGARSTPFKKKRPSSSQKKKQTNKTQIRIFDLLTAGKHMQRASAAWEKT